MTFADIARDQRRIYPYIHTTRINLWCHFFTAPLFALSVLWLAFLVVRALSFGQGGSCAVSLPGLGGFELPFACWVGKSGIAALLLALLALGAQRITHRTEQMPATELKGIGYAIRFALVEQFITFRRFFWSGGWLSNLIRAIR